MTKTIKTPVWVAAEVPFKTKKTYARAAQSDVILDVRFTHKETGKVLVRPAFWDGGNTFRVRFAPTKTGVWQYRTVCESDESLHDLSGTVEAIPYEGELDIYRHGFVTSRYGKKYFTYDDGTPFFYLGDTHWSMYTEEIDSPGDHACDIKTDSHFKYIVDVRASQGFTVYQSEPIGAPFDLTGGAFTADTVKGFQKADEYYQYIAEKGLVHANAEFFFAGRMTENLMNDTAYLEKISRYWVARFGAYPVMWTLGQEIDNDFYYELVDHGTGGHNGHPFYDYSNNPWVKIAEFLHKYDAYHQPLSGHQENTGHTTVTGKGVSDRADGEGKSVFLSERVTARTGHDWWAAQIAPPITVQGGEEPFKDYWNSPKIAVCYEPHYTYLWTKEFGARARGWITLLSGFFGHGYGAADIWLYCSTYDMNRECSDGVDTITVEDKKLAWGDAIRLASGDQMGYMRSFFEKLPWWELTPDFNEQKHFIPAEGTLYKCAFIGQDATVVYFYNRTKTAGTLCGLDTRASYTLVWFDPVKNTYALPLVQTPDRDGTIALIAKPSENDQVLLVRRI